MQNDFDGSIMPRARICSLPHGIQIPKHADPYKKLSAVNKHWSSWLQNRCSRAHSNCQALYFCIMGEKPIDGALLRIVCNLQRMGACSWMESHELQITHHATGADGVRMRTEWEYHGSESLPHAAARLVNNGAMRPHLQETCKKSIIAHTSICFLFSSGSSHHGVQTPACRFWQ